MPLFDEADRQIIVLALAELELERPGWAELIREIAVNYDPDLNTFMAMKANNADRVQDVRGSLHEARRFSDQDDNEYVVVGTGRIQLDRKSDPKRNPDVAFLKRQLQAAHSVLWSEYGRSCSLDSGKCSVCREVEAETEAR